MEVRLPAKAEYLSLLRLVVAGVCRQIPLNEDAIDDLKLAVSEICSRSIENNLTDKLLMQIQPAHDSVRVTLGPFLNFETSKMFPSPYFSLKTFESLLDDFKTDYNENFYYAKLVKKVSG